MSNRDEYTRKIKHQLDELSASMDDLEANAKTAKAEARETFKLEMGKLREQSKAAMAKLEELKEASEDGWKAMVEGTEKLRDAFTHSFHYFKSQLQEPAPK